LLLLAGPVVPVPVSAVHHSTFLLFDVVLFALRDDRWEGVFARWIVAGERRNLESVVGGDGVVIGYLRG
jgi:hypothetical protein